MFRNRTAQGMSPMSLMEAYRKCFRFSLIGFGCLFFSLLLFFLVIWFNLGRVLYFPPLVLLFISQGALLQLFFVGRRLGKIRDGHVRPVPPDGPGELTLADAREAVRKMAAMRDRAVDSLGDWNWHSMPDDKEWRVESEIGEICLSVAEAHIAPLRNFLISLGIADPHVDVCTECGEPAIFIWGWPKCGLCARAIVGWVEGDGFVEAPDG